MSDLASALIHYIGTLPEGHVLREIAERTLHDYNKKQTAYVSVESNQSHAVLRLKTKPRKIKVTQASVHDITRTNLKYLREKYKLEIEDFALQFGYSRSMYKNMEAKNGSTRPTLHLVVAVCMRYDISIDLFVHELISEQ